MGQTNTINLQIPSSCSEDWNGMTPRNGGRHCDSCQKTVIDFTGMSDAELLKFFTQCKGDICGRFLPHQLNRDITTQPGTNVWFKYLIPASIPALLLFSQAEAQSKSRATRIEINPVKRDSVSNNTPVAARLVKGIIVDSNGNPVPHASIVVRYRALGTMADASGRFELRISQLPVVLDISSIGYDAQEIIANDSNLTVTLRQQTLSATVGGVVYVRTRRKRSKTDKKHNQVTNIQNSKSEQLQPDLQLYPNPLQSGSVIHFKIQNTETGEYEVEVVSFSGQLMQSSVLKVESRNEDLTFLLNKLLPGTYLLRMTHKTKRIQLTRQLVIL